MFDKLKQLKQLKELQSKLSQEEITVEKNGVKVVINGQMEVKEIRLNPTLGQQEQEKLVRDCFNEAVKKIQLTVAQKMFSM